jgi:hypothetical protein
MPTVRGKYSSDSLGKDKVTKIQQREVTSKDGVDYTDIIDRNSRAESNYGHTDNIKRGGKKR